MTRGIKGGVQLGMLERFWSKVDQSGGEQACWPWLGTCSKGGYGQFKGQRPLDRNFAAHRFAFEITTTEQIPAGLQLDHLCRNPVCVNPAHLEPVTNRENTLRGLHPNVDVYHRGVCKRGHLRTPENVLKGGKCRQCNIDLSRARRERLKEIYGPRYYRLSSKELA